MKLDLQDDMSDRVQTLKKIALIGPLPPPFGGMANQTLQLSRLLKEEGINVRLIRTNTPYRPAWAGKLRGVRAFFRLIPYIYNLWNGLKSADVAHIMANSGWSWHLFTAPAIWLARLRGVPVIVNYRGGEAESFLDASLFWVKLSLRSVSSIVVPSGFLEAVFGRFDIETVVIANIIDVSRFIPHESKEIEQRSPHFIICRNLESIYDNATAIRAFSRVSAVVPDARLTIAGEGPEKSTLGKLVEELKIDGKVSFAGRINVDKMVNLYQSADIMLNASRVDNMPNALLEAMSAGVPIVTTDAGGIPFMVSDYSTALLVPIGDSKRMAEASLEIISQKELYEKLSENGKKEVKRYQWESVGPQWLRLYCSLCN